MEYKIKVKSCFECPFKNLELPTFVDGNVRFNRLSCYHPSFADREIFATVMIEGEQLKNHKIFDCCPLKNNPVNVMFEEEQTDPYKKVFNIDTDEQSYELTVTDVKRLNNFYAHEIASKLIALFKQYEETVSWGGENRRIRFAAQVGCNMGGEFEDVIVYEAGIKGPADVLRWDREQQVFKHAGYTAYKTTYTIEELVEYIHKIHLHNKNYHGQD